jgi:hypothetical protein
MLYKEVLKIRYKYPHTPHLPWSNLNGSNRRVLNCTHFEGKEVVITEKLDAEGITLYSDYLHARSIDSSRNGHLSRCIIKRLHSEIKFLIPQEVYVCGEYMYAKHSIYYDALTSWFYVFGVYNKNTCLSWDQTVEFCKNIKLETVPILYRGIWDEELTKKLWPFQSNFSKTNTVAEGYVVRVAESFNREGFPLSVAKFVRPNHVQTTKHWIKDWYPNKLVGNVNVETTINI